MLAALPHDIERDVGMRGNHHAIDGHRDGGQVWIGRSAFNFGRVWVDGEDFIPAVFQPVINSVGRLARGTGNTRNGKALSPKKLGD